MSDIERGLANDKPDREVLAEGDRLLIRKARIADADFMSEVERDADNSPWVANWPIDWRICKFGDADFLQTMIERRDGTPIGLIIFRNLLRKEEAVELKRIAIIEKGKGYGKEAIYLAQKVAFEVFGTKRLYLSTKAENLRAQSVYKATGFTPELPDPCTKFSMDKEAYEKGSLVVQGMQRE
ncbi:MAG: GNAT family N-acetyltransferase [Lachnospiraceae bacterium]